jgi:hypothetical protein
LLRFTPANKNKRYVNAGSDRNNRKYNKDNKRRRKQAFRRSKEIKNKKNKPPEMKQTNEQFKKDYNTGVTAEKKIGKILEAKGLNFLPLYQFDSNDAGNHAPKIYGGSGWAICPDFIAWQDNKQFFIEVKHQSNPVKYRGNTEFTLNKYSYNQYLQVEKATGAAVWIVFYYPLEPYAEIYAARLADYTRIWDGKHTNGSQIRPPCYLYDQANIKRLYMPRKNELFSFL